MDHDHSGRDMDMCSMDMLFTWNTKNLCVVFKWWHVRTRMDLILTFIAVIVLGMGYEYLKSLSAKLDDLSAAAAYRQQPLLDNSTSSPSNLGYNNNVQDPYRTRKSILYGAQVFYSFFLM